MVAGEITAAVVLALASALAVALKKSRCFVRRLADGWTWGVGFCDRPLLPRSPTKINEASHCRATAATPKRR